LSSWTAAIAARSAWKFAFLLYETVTLGWLDRFAFEAGIHLFKGPEGTWRCIARDKTQTPAHFFSPLRIAVKNPDATDLDPDTSLRKTAARDVINEIVLRYHYDPISKTYLKVKARTCRYRYTGTCTVDSATGRLTDGSASFLTGPFPAQVGEKVYRYADQEYEVAAVVSDTVLEVTPLLYDAVTDDATPASYWGGPYVSGKMVRSWLRYKTVNPLGGEYDPLTNEGGYPSDFIADDDTADLFLDFCEDWYTDRHFIVEFADYLQAVDVEPGDLCYLRHPWLPDNRDAVLLGALDGAILAGAGTITLAADANYHGSLAFRQNDYVSIDGEVLQVTSEAQNGNEDLAVTRAQINTTAAAHADGALVYLLIQKWEVLSVRPDPEKGQIHLELLEMPKDYARIGCALPDDYGLFDDQDYAGRVSGSWAHPPSGLIFEEDAQTDYTYARG
jgi:hypothetical protein